MWWGIKGVEEGLKGSGKEAEERIDKDNMLGSRWTWDQHLSLLFIKRLERYMPQEEPQE